MANWIKRGSKKTGTHSRSTTTTNQKGGSVRSSSVKTGKNAPRYTESVKISDGKIKHVVYKTEWHPTLGYKRTQRTVNASSNAKPKKPKKVSSPRVSKGYNTSNGSPQEISKVGCAFVIILFLAVCVIWF